MFDYSVSKPKLPIVKVSFPAFIRKQNQRRKKEEKQTNNDEREE